MSNFDDLFSLVGTPNLKQHLDPYRGEFTIQRNQPSERDAWNRLVPKWEDFATVSGQLVPLSGQELERARRTVAEVTHLISVDPEDYTAGITSDMRATLDGRTFHLLHVENEGTRGVFQHLLCKEEVAA